MTGFIIKLISIKVSFIDEDLTFFSQKPLAHFQQKFECKLEGTIYENLSTFCRSHDQDGCHAHIW